MKNLKTTLLCLSLGFALGANAAPQSKLDLRGRAIVREAKIAARQSKSTPSPRMVKARTAGEQSLMHAFVTLNSGFSASDLADIDGLTVESERGPRVLAAFPESAISQLENSAAVKAVQLERPLKAKLNIARKLSGVDQIHQGEALPQPYTGKGVICALVDGGFDPNHVNFLNADGTNRIENFTYFRPTQNGGANTEVYGADYMPNIDTESSETFHGTHTMGIMAGSYRGKVTAGQLTDNGEGFLVASVEEIDNPYYGVAPDAGIAAASGAGTDYYVALAIDQILNYSYWKASETKQVVPVVLNLSIGSNVGPHDGSSYLSQVIDWDVDDCNKDKVVSFIPVISAGNEGDLNIALHKTLSEGDTEMKTAFLSSDLFAGKYPNALYGQVYLYSDSAEPFEVQAVIINKERGRVAVQNALSASPEGASKYICSSSDYVQDSETETVVPTMAKHFEGYLGVMGQLDTEESGRYVSIIDMMLWETEANQGNYCVGLIVKGKPGQRIDAYCTGDWFDFSDHGMAADGYLKGTTDGTISDLACGKNVIVVGSYNARNYWANIDKTIGGYPDDMFSNNKVSDFTSWGTLVDGRQLPHVCAPGATVISSSNEYYIKDNGVKDDQLQATFTDGTRRYSWHQCVGTSMSTPLVAGSIALWLEADPTLTLEEAREIIARTATVDDDVRAGNPVQWGAGKFNAYEGLKEVLSRQASINGVGADKASELLVNRRGDEVEVTLPGALDMDVRIYAANGAAMGQVKSAGNTATLSLGGLPKGVYVINVNGLRSHKLVK